MTDTEQIYALYVQANPVPDPDALALEQTEAELLTNEGSTDMDTREQIKARPSPASKPRRRALALGLAAVVVVAAVGVGALVMGGGGDNPVAAADAQPKVVFDGSTCQYVGPTLIEEGNAEFTLVNSSSSTFKLATWRMMSEADLETELARFPLGQDGDEDGNMPSGQLLLNNSVQPGSELTLTPTLRPGPHINDCLVFVDGAGYDRVVRAATVLEVVTP